tara:strand:- start:3586 stop:5115 length:1530 start_codon:yes stop_codon:yes gene_type:complete
MSCDICAEDFTKEKRMKVPCPGCDINVCRECVRRYLTGEDMVEDPHCMGCRIAWQQKIVKTAVGPSFITKQMVQHRRKVLLGRSKANIPQVQEYAVARRDLPFVSQSIEAKRHEMNLRHIEERRHLESVVLKEEKIEKSRLERLVHGTSERQQQERAAFVHKCSSENCEGFLSSGWKCGVCNSYTCNECGKNIGQYARSHDNCEHMCEANDVESFRLVRNSCRPCPNCATQIYKIDGCDQMWCTQCQTPFSWRTGHRLNGTVHNPHFFEWARRGGRQIPRNGPRCGRVDTFELVHAVNRVFPDNRVGSISYTLTYILQRRQHFNNVDVVNLRGDVDPNVERDLLAKFIVNEISENEFSTKLQIADKKRRFTRELLEIYDTVSNVLIDQLTRATEAGNEQTVSLEEGRYRIFSVLSEIQDFTVYIVGQLHDINSTYKYTRSTLLESLREIQFCITWAFRSSGHEKPSMWNGVWNPGPNNLTEIGENWSPRGQHRRTGIGRMFAGLLAQRF